MDGKKGVDQTIENNNTRLYKAFESLSIEKMEEVWKHSDDTIAYILEGDVYRLDGNKESWIRIFENTRMINSLLQIQR